MEEFINMSATDNDHVDEEEEEDDEDKRLKK